MSVLIGPSVDEVVVSEAMIAEGVDEDGAEFLIVGFRAGILDPRDADRLRHGVTFMFQPVAKVMDVVGVVKDLVSAVALYRTVVLHLLRHVVLAAHPLQIGLELRPDAAHEGLPLQTAQGRLPLAERDAQPQRVRPLQVHDAVETSHGHPARMAESYADELLNLQPPNSKTSRTHHRPGSQDHALDLVLLRAVDADPRAARVLEARCGSAGVGTLLLKLTRMVHALTCESASDRLVQAGRGRPQGLVEDDAE